MKILEQTDKYTIYQDTYKNQFVIVRKWHDTDEYVELKVNNALAICYGYRSLNDMINKTRGRAAFKKIGGVPEWIRLTLDG